MKARSAGCVLGLLALTFCGRAFAQGGEPVHWYRVILDRVSTDCEKAHRGARGLMVTLEAHIENHGCTAQDAEIRDYTSPRFIVGSTNDTAEYNITPASYNPPRILMNGTPVYLDFWVTLVKRTASLGTVTDGEI